MEYVIYLADTETTGLNSHTNDIIELSFYRLNDNIQKTWCLKPFNYSAIEAAALRVNGHKLEDLKLETKYGVKNEKAHSAAADTKATKEVFEKQVEIFRKILNA